MRTILNSRMLVFYSFLIFISTQITFCTVEQPQAPRWEVPLTVPIVNTTYLASDLAEDFDNLKILDNNTMGFSLNDALDTVFVDELEITSQQSYTTNIEVGNFKIKVEETVTDSSITFGRIWPDALQYSGVYMPVPAFTFNQVKTDKINFDEFEFIDVFAGRAILAMTNRFPFPIGPMNLLIHDSNQNLITQIYFPDIIPSGATSTEMIDLAGKQIFDDVQVEISGQSVGSEGATIFIDPEDNLLFEISFEELTVTQALAKISPFEVDSSEQIELFDTFSITTAGIQSGQLQLNLKNNIPMNLFLTLEFPEILNSAGIPLKKEMDIPEGGEKNSSISLDGFHISFPQNSNQLTVIAKANFMGTGSEYREITSQDYFALSLELNDFTVNNFKGVLSTTTLQVPPTTTELDLPDDLDRLQFQNAGLRLNFHNRVNFPIELAMELKGSNANGNTATLPVNIVLPPSGENTEKLTTLIMDKNNSAVVDFINIIPTRIEITGTAQIGDGFSTGSLSSADYIFVDYQIEAPFHVSFEEQTIYPDTSEIIILPKDFPSDDFDGKSTIDGELTENLQRGDIQLTVRNLFPVGCQLKIKVSNDLAAIDTNPSFVLGPIDIAHGEIDVNGNVQQELVSSHDISITAEQMLVFKNSTDLPKTIYFRPEIKLQSTENPILLNADDYISIISFVKFNVLVSSN